MNTKENSPCERAVLISDYAFDELPHSERRSMEQHLAQCSDCAAELDRLRLTTAALRVLPDQEVPRRIAFVSDKVFETHWLSRFWNSAARLGFASACVLAAGLSFAAYHLSRQPEVRTVVQSTEISKAVIAQVVAEAVDKAHAEDIQMTKAALDAVDTKYTQKQQNLMVAMQSSLEYMRSHYQMTTRALYSDGIPGAAQ